MLPRIGSKIKCNFSFSGALLAQKQDINTLSSTSSNPDPTSLEFGDKFEQLVKAAISNSSRKLILVLDNLDRIDQDSALSILTTLQTFLQHDIKEKQEYKGIWVIIPYDLQGLSRIWNPNKDPSNAVTFSMLNKRFQIRFYVPPLLLSDLRQYVIDQLKIAFPDHRTIEHLKDLNSTYLIYRDLIASEKGTTPSPRDIKIFINQIGAIHRQWGDEFPIHHIAYYVLSTRTSEDFPDKLRRKELANPKLFDLGENILSNLAAMYFNVDVTSAFQFLLQGEMEAALTQKKHETIEEFERLHTKGFWATLENIHFDQYGLAQLAYAGGTLEKSRIFSQEGNASQKDIILSSLSAGALNSISGSVAYDNEIAQGLIAIARLSSKPQIIEKTVIRISSDLTKEASLNFPIENIPKWTQGLLTTIKDDWVRGNAKLPENILIPGNADTFLVTCSNLFDFDEQGEAWTVFSPAANHREIIDSFKAIVESSSLNDRRKKALTVATTIFQDEIWKEVAGIIYERLKSLASYENEELRSLFACLWILNRKKYTAELNIPKLISQGSLFHHLNAARNRTDKDWPTIAWCIYFILRTPSAVDTAPPSGTPQEGWDFLMKKIFEGPPEELVEPFTQLVINEKEISFLLDLPDTANPFLKRVFARIKTTPNHEDFFTPELMSNNWSRIKLIFSEGGNEAIMQLAKKSDLSPFMSQQTFDLEHSQLYADIVTANTENNDGFTVWCLENLANISKDLWTQHLANESTLINLLLALTKTNAINSERALGVSLQDALYEHAQGIINGNNPPGQLREQWHQLPKALKRNLESALTKLILKTAKDSKGQLNDEFFNYYGEIIAQPKILRTDQEVVLLLFSPLIENKNLKGIEWINRFITENPRFLESYGLKDDVGAFRQRVREAAELTPGEQQITEEAINLIRNLDQIINKNEG